MEMAAIVGADGGIGSALADMLETGGDYSRVLRLSRRPGADINMELTDEASIAAAATQISEMRDSLTLCIVATGLLHKNENGPEKTLRSLDPAWMMENYRINTIGPAIVAKHFLPVMPRRSAYRFAAISARVGSISDNRLGGWHSYRASKAALNMVIRNLGIEIARSNSEAIIAALHPGTVDTGLSAPFQANVAEGKLFTAQYSASRMLQVLLQLTPADSGKIFAWDGEEIAP